MGKVLTSSLLLVGLAGGVAVALAYRISRETGKDLPDAFKAIPAEVRRYADDLRQRLEEAVSAGRQAAAAKEQEIDELLASKARGPASIGVLPAS